MTQPRRHNLSDRAARIGAAAGFTLVELMISIALVLVLLLGVNQVFSLTSKTIGAGQALSDIHRDDRSIQGTLYYDFTGYANDAPMFILSQKVTAFRNRQDRQTDRDGNVATFDAGNVGTESPVVPWYYGPRSHRVDRIGFFARGNFPRQTGSGAAFVDTVNLGGTSHPTTASEAYIWYGHLSLPNPTLGESDSAYASSFVDPGTFAHDASTYASNWYLGRVVMLLSTTPPAGQSFYTGNNPIGKTGSKPDVSLSRYDLAQLSINGYTTGQAKSSAHWLDLTSYRFRGNPHPTHPLTSDSVALTVPCFVKGCSQFIVEYAGDFTTQDPGTGKIVKTGINPDTGGPTSAPDGIVDFTVDAAGNHLIRWYGFPRDTNDNGVIDAGDVLPLYDRIKADISGVPAPFEREEPTGGPSYDKLTESGTGSRYFLTWGPDLPPSTPRPSMLRITVSLDDADNRIGTAQTFEYVIKLQE